MVLTTTSELCSCLTPLSSSSLPWRRIEGRRNERNRGAARRYQAREGIGIDEDEQLARETAALGDRVVNQRRRHSTGPRNGTGRGSPSRLRQRNRGHNTVAQRRQSNM